MLFCRSSVDGSFLWSRGDGIPAARLVDASATFSGSCGSVSIDHGSTALADFSRGFSFLHCYGSRVVAVTQSAEDRGEFAAMVPVVTSWELSGGLAFALMQSDFPAGMEVINAIGRSGIVWIQTIHNQGGELLAVDGLAGLRSRSAGFGLLISQGLGPMILADGSAYVANGSRFGRMRPNGSLIWSRSNFVGSQDPEFFMYPNGDLLHWNRDFYAGQLTRIDGQTGATIATSEKQGERYSFRGDGRPGPLDGSGGSFIILPDGRLGFNGFYTGELYGYLNGSEEVVFPTPTTTPGTLPPGAVPLWQVISGLIDQNLRITEWREDRSAVGGEADSIVGYLKGNANDGLTWNDQFETFVGRWRSETDIPDDLSATWPTVPGYRVDERPQLKGQPTRPGVRDAFGNWYSPELDKGDGRIKSISSTGSDRWSVDLGWSADLQFKARAIAISGAGSRVYYLG